MSARAASVARVSFVPVSGPATFRPAEPPREGVVEFTDDQRTVALPIRAALPVLTRARARDDLHPTVGLLAGAALLAMRLVAAGKLAPGGDPPAWRVSGLDTDDEDRIWMLARGGPEEERLVRSVLDAVADAMPRTPPTSVAPAGAAPTTSSTTGSTTGSPSAPHTGTGTAVRRGAAAPARRPSFEERLQQRLARHQRLDGRDLPHLVTLSLRVEADEEELVAGAVRVVAQAHDDRNPLHLCDLAMLWTGTPEEHGFGDRARTHATIALRAAADAWPVLDRLLEQRIPDQLTLGSDEILSLLTDGVGALRAVGVDVLWPRSLGRDLTATTVLDTVADLRPSRPPTGGPREEPLNEPVLSTEALFAFRWQLAVDGDPLTPEEMDALAAAASPVLRLRGSWMVVDPATAAKARKRLVRTVGSAEAVAATLTGTVQVADHEEQVIVGASLLKVRERLLSAATREPVPAPAALRATLRDYQRHGLTWLAELTDLGVGAVLADDMGLGKTVTLIALHLHRREQAAALGRSAGPTLVVCPASLLGNWEAEVRRFAPGTPVVRFHGSARDVSAARDGFVLTTYGTLRSDAVSLRAAAWDLVVADEAQHVKNPRTATARALRSLESRARVALTGTPVENDLTELWAILDWATPGLLGSRNAFRRAWAAPIESGREPRTARRFAELVGPFLLRRRKSDPGIAPELPPKTETDHLLRLTREQVVLYESFVRDTMARIERADPSDDVARRGLVLMLLTGLKQICNHPDHFLKRSGVRLAGRSQKVDLLDELVGTVLSEDGAMLVFTQYVAMARLLEGHLARAGVPHQLLHGGTPVRDRDTMVRRFQGGEVPVFLLSLKAGGTGLNLTRADHVVHVDRWWNPAVEEQATDRAHRIGQTRPVQVHRMITQGTVEERIAELLTRKRALADAVLGRGEAALTELTDAELRDLVSLRRDDDPPRAGS